MFTCTKCLTSKEADAFYVCGTSNGRDGYTYWCKDCYAANYKANRTRQLASNRRAAIKRRYGLTVEEYDEIIARGCAICGETEKRIVLDHCHSSGKTRDALCDQCNQLLGNARDNPEYLRQAVRYLSRHGQSHPHEAASPDA